MADPNNRTRNSARNRKALDEIKKLEQQVKANSSTNNSIKFDTDLDNIQALVEVISSRNSKKTSQSSVLSTMGSLTDQSLLNEEISESKDKRKTEVLKNNNTKKLIDSLEKVDQNELANMFFAERNRLDDYSTYKQIYDFIPEVAEAVGNHLDNIMSPNDFSNMSIPVNYKGSNSNESEFVKDNCQKIITKYNLEQKVEESILSCLISGDSFLAIFNLREELEKILLSKNEAKLSADGLILGEGVRLYDKVHILDNIVTFENYVENGEKNILELEEIKMLVETTLDEKDVKFDVIQENKDLAKYLDTFFESTSSGDIDSNFLSTKLSSDVDIYSKVKEIKDNPSKEAKIEKLKNIKGSVVKAYRPENVIKLFIDDTQFGYFVFDYTDVELAEIQKRGYSDQTSAVKAVDRNLSGKFNPSSSVISNSKENYINKILTKVFLKRIGSSEFINKNVNMAGDIHGILRQALKTNQKIRTRFVPNDKMVHFTPNGTDGYGDSILHKIKFVAKLYIGAMTNAFMRNTIRQNERLVWYIDIGLDNDAQNSIQNFIRTVKQKEVKFSSLKDITTTINSIGEFHDFYIPTYNGDKPVDIEVLNMGSASDVDNPYLQFLKKMIITGTGTPGAFIGQMDEIQYARTLTSENGRYLRRIIRIQRPLNNQLTKAMIVLYRNEFYSLEELKGEASEKNEEGSQYTIDPSLIYVKLPIPILLNISSFADVTNQIEPISQFITQTIEPDTEKSKEQAILKAEITKSLAPQVDWNMYQKMYNNILIKIEADKQKKQMLDDAANSIPTDTSGDAGGATSSSDSSGDGSTTDTTSDMSGGTDTTESEDL